MLARARYLLLPLTALLLIIPGSAKPQAAQGKKALPVPDHGMVLGTCIEVAPRKLKDTTNLADTTNYVFRGRVISLNKDRTVSLCFDTEHMRVAGAWVGKPAGYVADKNMGPPIEGQMLFTTRPGPGWAKHGAWDGPRPGKEGPLPRDWAHYRGLYLHGEQVILSYTVGDCPVLEWPSSEQAGTVVAITRTLNLGPSARPLTLLVCEQPGATGSTRALGGGQVAELLAGESRVVAGVAGAPAGTTWEIAGARLHLKLPAMPKGGSLRLVVARLPADGGLDTFAGLLRGKVADLQPRTRGGPSRWNQILETKGTRAPNKGPYVIDPIDLPLDNPWRATLRFGGLDFFSDGRAALCTWDGDVWVVSGLDDKLDRVRWKRFATGLHQPLGLKIIGDVIYTAGRDQVTRLHDLNGDGEADFYENFNNDAGLTLQRHEFVMDLQTDSKGNLYYGRSGHYINSKKGANCCVYKLAADGSKLEVFARGFREPNGLSIGPDGTMTVSDNEGNNIPQTPLYHLKQGAAYGYEPSRAHDGGKGGTWQYLQKPIVWLPKTVDRSAGGQVWVTSEKWGPLKGGLLHTSYGHCALYGVLIDRQAEPWQGAVWKFPLAFQSGIMRARFHPKDGQLYLCGLRGWDTNAVKDGQFCRVRYTGNTTPVPTGMRVTKAGVEVTFSAPLDRAAAEDEGNWAGEWSGPANPKGRPAARLQEWPIEAVRLGPDRRTVVVELERVVPTMNFTLQYRLKSAGGASVRGALHGTIHRVP
ncbi:MAG: hypothetical protein L0Z62_48500 [Gemmataceae bacterium]|nr:hypothetical protein [Gemmataceae bacterium]